MSADEARSMAAGNPVSFLHVSRPEIDFPPGTDPTRPEVYRQAAENLQKLVRDGALITDPNPSFYLYRQVMDNHSQTGLVAVASCEDYLHNRIKKHEFTRPDKENDRVQHMEALSAQTGPVFLTYRGEPELDARLQALSAGEPDMDFATDDGVRHSTWPIADPTEMDRLKRAFQDVPALYIADGHHRSAAAGRVFESRGGAGGSSHFLSVIFPHHQLRILPYNRVLKRIHEGTADDLLKRLTSVFDLLPAAGAAPERRHEVGLYVNGAWRMLRFRDDRLNAPEPVNRLDVALLQNHVLQPMFGIDDPRTSKDIQFVGGIRGTRELEAMVDSGEFACAFSLYPTGIEELMAIADEDGVMPPKSTWFEPKLRDAMFSHWL